MFSRSGVAEVRLCIRLLACLQQAGSVTSKAVTLPIFVPVRSCRRPPPPGVAQHRSLYSKNRQMPQKIRTVKGQTSDGAAAAEAGGPVTRDKNGAVTIKVHAKPGSKHSGITEVSAESVSVAISAPPTDGEANTELIRYLAEVLGMKKSHMSLDKDLKSKVDESVVVTLNSHATGMGSRSRDKLIRVHSPLSPEEVLQRLRQAAG